MISIEKEKFFEYFIKKGHAMKQNNEKLKIDEVILLQ